MNNFRYEKYGAAGDIVTIDITDEYTVIAIIGSDKQNEEHYVTLFLKHKTVEDWKLIEKSKIKFTGRFNERYKITLREISKLYKQGFFDYYINRYEYELKCFDRGNALFEKEDFRLSPEDNYDKE